MAQCFFFSLIAAPYRINFLTSVFAYITAQLLRKKIIALDLHFSRVLDSLVKDVSDLYRWDDEDQMGRMMMIQTTAFLFYRPARAFIHFWSKYTCASAPAAAAAAATACSRIVDSQLVRPEYTYFLRHRMKI